MFVKLCVIACLINYIHTQQIFDKDRYRPYHIILNSRIITCSQDRSKNLDVSAIKIYFFDHTKNYRRSFPISIAAREILRIKGLDKTKKFVMFVGGFKSRIDGSILNQVSEAYKSFPNTYLIIPDHSTYTNDDDKRAMKNYKRSVLYVHYIGKALGQVLANLSLGGVSAKNIHGVGHSLGGQILGHVGSTFFDMTSKKIWRVSALDPAGPCFTSSAVEEQVRSGVAEYVEVYHCNAGVLGSANILADVDFFVNKNGVWSRACGNPGIGIFQSDKASTCAHRSCVDLWTTSVKNPNSFVAIKCESYEKYTQGKCKDNMKTIAGLGNQGNAYGIFYFSTDTNNLRG